MNKLHIVAVTAFIKNQAEDRYLVVKRKADEVAYGGMWAFPGGKVEQGETIMQALRREVYEEVGLQIDNYKKYLKDFTFLRPDNQNVIGFCFLVRATSEHVTLSKDFDEYRWILPGQMQELKYIPGMEEEVRLAFER